MAEKNERDRGVPGEGAGRRDEVGGSGVYPMSGPHPKGPADICTEPEFGQGERGAAGFEDHGTSELTYTEGQVLGALDEKSAEVPEGEVPRARWVQYFDRLSKRFQGAQVTVEIGTGAGRRTVQQAVRFDGIGADVKDRENNITITAGSDAVGEVTHLIESPRRVVLRREGSVHILEIESVAAPVTVLRIGARDVTKAA